MKPRIQLSAIATAMVLWLVAPAVSAGTPWEVDLVEGDFFLLRSEEVDWRIAAPSDHIRPGDRLWAASAGRAALAGPAGLRLRLDHGTQVELVADASRQRVSLLTGALYVKHPALGREGLDFELIAGPATLRSDEPTIMRVELLEAGAMAVTVYKGEVRVMTVSDNAWIRAGEQTQVTGSAVIGLPSSIVLTQRDAFDEWNEAQELQLARGDASYDDVGDAAEPDLTQLDDYGQWVSVTSYGRAWRPQVAVNWRPYFYGQWLWVSPYGWSWVSAEPWGYLPHHYGQWAWDSFYGWVWLPGRQWAPAWVVWTPYQGGWAWAPYGPYGVPIGLLHASVQLNYWCWSTQLGMGGGQHHRRMTTVPTEDRQSPPGARHYPTNVQPPRRSPSGERQQSEQVARLELRQNPAQHGAPDSARGERGPRAEARSEATDRAGGSDGRGSFSRMLGDRNAVRDDRAPERQNPRMSGEVGAPTPPARVKRPGETVRESGPQSGPARTSRSPVVKPSPDRGTPPARSRPSPHTAPQKPVERRAPVTPAAPSAGRPSPEGRAPVTGRVDRPARVEAPRQSDAPRMNGPQSGSMSSQTARRGVLFLR